MLEMLIEGLVLEGSTSAHGEYLQALHRGTKEPFTAELFARSVEPGDTVIDGGAYLGFYSLLAAQRVGPQGAVFAFEPNPRTFEPLRRNVSENGFEDRVIALPIGIDSAAGRRWFYLADHDASKSSLFVPERWQEATEAECIDVDGVLGSRSIDLVKLDIEGGEVDALRGMRGSLAASPDPCVIVECNPAALERAGRTTDDLLGELTGAGLEFAAIDDEMWELRDVEEALAATDGHVNLYCRRPGRARDRR
jgi:FkbM family methyltransferase